MLLLLLIMIPIMEGADILVIGKEDSKPRPAPCARICSGTTGTISTMNFHESDDAFHPLHGPTLSCSGRGKTNWTRYLWDFGITTTVDITECGFVETPNIVTSLEGRSLHWLAKGKIYASTCQVYQRHMSYFRYLVCLQRHFETF